MDADCDPLSGFARVGAMRQRAVAEGIPLHVSLALTHRCNLRCIHCYVLPNAASPRLELSTGDWLALAQEAADAGCFSMLLTGGEPLLRQDFADIYLGIRKMGIYTILFTNATQVNQSIVDVLCSAPPRLIEVTVYGASPETYGRVTGYESAYEDAMRGIAMLREAGLSVRLKTMLMKETFHEFVDLRALAADNELPMRYDATVHPRFPGDVEIQRQQVSPAQVTELEFRAVPELAKHWEKTTKRPPAKSACGRPRLYTCGAGHHACYVSAEGLVQPCTSTVRYGVRYERGGFLTAFRSGRRALQERLAPAGYQCATCNDRFICTTCPAISELASGDEAGIFSYACELAHERSRKMAEFKASIGSDSSNRIQPE
jgi:radical SAM protein with 4Fe4S-binding SPASM domain